MMVSFSKKLIKKNNLALVNCYECVPASFFDESFIFNFQNFSRNIKKMNEIQETVFLFVDLKSIFLSYQNI